MLRRKTEDVEGDDEVDFNGVEEERGEKYPSSLSI